MKYVLAPNNVFQRFVLPGEVVQFSDRCNTTAKRLTPEEAAEYGVSKLQLVSPPAYDSLTQSRTEAEPSLVNGVWVQQWVVVALPQADVDANIIAGKADLKARVTEKRSQVEEGGTTIAGVAVKTDAGSQAKLTGALNFVGRNPIRTIKWKTAAGTFAPLNKAAIEAISDGVGEFVALCFDAEAAHYAAIDALTTPAQVAAYDVNTGWPV